MKSNPILFTIGQGVIDIKRYGFPFLVKKLTIFGHQCRCNPSASGN